MECTMPLGETLAGMFRRNASRYLYVPIPADHVRGGQQDHDALVEGRDYFRLWLTEMSLKRDRDWFKTWHPAVHSLVHFQFGDRVIDVPNIVGEHGLKDVDSAHLERNIAQNYPLTALMPYSGGVVDVTVALFAMQGQDYLKRFIKVLNGFAGLVAVPQLSAALAVAGPLASGIDELLGVSDGQMHLGLHQAYVHKGGGDNELLPAYYAAILATEAQVDPATLWVVDGHLRRGGSVDANEPFMGYAYLLLRVQKETKRDDWEGLTSFMKPFEAAVRERSLGHKKGADSHYRAALAAALSSADLTQADKYRVAKVLEKRYGEAGSLGLGAIPAWGSFTAAVDAIPVDEALGRRLPDITEFLPADGSGWSPSGLGE
jgi:hypothetical protein